MPQLSDSQVAEGNVVFWSDFFHKMSHEAVYSNVAHY